MTSPSAWLLLALAAVASACGSTPAGPTPPVKTPVSGVVSGSVRQVRWTARVPGRIVQIAVP